MRLLGLGCGLAATPMGLAAAPVDGGRAWLGYSQRQGPTGVEGTGGSRGTGCGARGRRQGLA